MGDRISVAIKSDADIVAARQAGRSLAGKIGFSSMDSTMIATTISELARNILTYARRGTIIVEEVKNDTLMGIRVTAKDKGPGIANVQKAMEPGFSTSGGLGLGLPGVKRLMDEFRIVSSTERGTVATAVKWSR